MLCYRCTSFGIWSSLALGVAEELIKAVSKPWTSAFTFMVQDYLCVVGSNTLCTASALWSSAPIIMHAISRQEITGADALRRANV
jgi:hypothetical protein